MRIKVNFKANNTILKNNLEIVSSYVHKCLGPNNKWHDEQSFYSVSQFLGGKFIGQTIVFNTSACFIISSPDIEFIGAFLEGIIKNKNVTKDINTLVYDSVEYINEEFYNGWNYFKTLSPFIIKKDKNGFYKLTDNNFQQDVENYLIKKLKAIKNSKKIELELNDFKVVINEHQKNKVKNVFVKNIRNVANECQINIYTNKKVAELLYNIGIGQSTGIGFGTICKTENYKTLYQK